MDPYEEPQSALTIAFHRGLYLAIIIDRYVGLQSDLSIAFHRGV
jgi:hypothetical protein